ncbi:MAG: hypothetical protein HYR89_02910 [Actinobacteria bacterium]|nr:hypothetical protein [Actinomycetota bacterium]MBI3256743.1 hypothetical protein [Actinomycetota bacterium]
MPRARCAQPLGSVAFRQPTSSMPPVSFARRSLEASANSALPPRSKTSCPDARYRALRQRCGDLGGPDARCAVGSPARPWCAPRRRPTHDAGVGSPAGRSPRGGLAGRPKLTAVDSGIAGCSQRCGVLGRRCCAHRPFDLVGPWGGALLGLYSLGLGVPFVLPALGFSRAQRSLGWLRRHGRHIEHAGGALLVGVGLRFQGEFHAQGPYVAQVHVLLDRLK